MRDAQHGGFHRERLNAYYGVFGDSDGGYAGAEATDQCPQVAMLRYAPGSGGRPFFTLVTSGMSDRPMNVPPGTAANARRTEIVLYAKEPKDEYLRWIHWTARFPFIDDTFLTNGHTIRWHEPLFPGSELTCMLLIDPVVRGDRELYKTLTIGGDPVRLLWWVPISEPERVLRWEQGLEALMDLFQQHGHPLEINEQRKSYV